MNRADFAKRNAPILELWDAGHSAHEITKTLGFPNRWTVDNVLNAYRPDRERFRSSPRSREPSGRPVHWRTAAIRQLAAKGIYQSEIARLLDVSRQHVSAVLLGKK
jgi:hypothetical protein